MASQSSSRPGGGEGQSGAALDRPGTHRLRNVIDVGGTDRVYAVAFDRPTRIPDPVVASLASPATLPRAAGA